MPAKTVKDLVEVNKFLYKIGQKISVGVSTEYGDQVFVYFCDEDGDRIEQYDQRRMEYYNLSPSYAWEQEEESSRGIPRFVEPETDKPLFPWGEVSAHKMSPKDGICHNAWVLGRSSVAKGYGPLLYDCLLVILGQHGIGLTASRDRVSSMASSVWINYFEKRSDVDKKPLDIDGTMTPNDPTDDCVSAHEEHTEWNPELAEPHKDDPEFEKKKARKTRVLTAVNHAYFDKGIPTLNELKRNRLFKNYGISIDKDNLDERVQIIYNELISETVGK